MKDEERFLRDLERSRQAVNEFAARAAADGIQVWLPPERTRPDEESRREYSDNGDMMVQGRIEHKIRDLDFTHRGNYPYDTVFIDEVYNADQKVGTPLLYVIENRARTHAAVVYGFTRPDWTIVTKFDAAQNRECRFYAAHKNKVRFCKVEDVFVVEGLTA